MRDNCRNQVRVLDGLMGSEMPEEFYVCDRPNPRLREFVVAHAAPFDPKADSYLVAPFSNALHVENRRSAINDLHIYWSKKPHDAVQAYVDHYALPGSVVLDPFCGSGGTALCALRRGCPAIAIDLSPAATFITKYYCTPVKLDDFELALAEVDKLTRPVIDWLYEARTAQGAKATVAYTVWSQVFQCPRCLSPIPLGLCVDVPGINKDGTPRKSRTGGQVTTPVCPICHSRGVRQEIDAGSPRLGRIPIRSSLLVRKGTKQRRNAKTYPYPYADIRTPSSVSLESIAQACKSPEERFEIERLMEIRDHDIPYPYPRTRMMHSQEKRWGVLWRAGVADFSTVDELFEKRALWGLAAYFDAVRKVECPSDVKDALLGVLSSALWNCSRMYRERKAGGGPQEGVYYLPPLSREVNIANVIAGKARTFVEANREIAQSLKSAHLLISTQSATDLSGIPANSVDYIFTDPPYSWKVPYGELNFLWESFLQLRNDWHDQEVIVSDVRGVGETEWGNRLRQALGECYRVLKPGRCLTLCYHDNSAGTWERLQDIMAECGFMPEETAGALSIGTGQKSLKQLTSGTITQRDLVINFRKPKPNELAGCDGSTTDDISTFRDSALEIIRDYLANHPGTTKDRIYDELVSRLVRQNRMTSHNFEELLLLVGEPAGDRQDSWFLRDYDSDKLDAAESARENTASMSLRQFISDCLEQHPEQEGVHYSDLFEHYVYHVKDKPRRQLQDWIHDYFYKAPGGTYRLPLNEEEEEAKVRSRLAGTHRRVKRYLAFLQRSLPIPERERPNDATLMDWIRHCKRSGLFEEGKLLYERGGLNIESLPESFVVDVEEDYQICVRMLLRGAGAEDPRVKRGRLTSREVNRP